jgi:lincosamide nucleotidyltransferase A/C/D/E
LTSADVLEVLDCLAAADVEVWLDGGWGVDALVGEETRPHFDLDVALNRDDLDRAREALQRRGFRPEASAQPGLSARLVMRDASGREGDLHPLVLDDAGDGWQQLSSSGNAWGRYPAEELAATGVVARRRVRCLGPELQYRFRMGYEWAERDEHDIRLLSRRFGLPLPPSLRRS